MKKNNSVLRVLMTGLLVVSAAGIGHAGDLMVSGFGSIDFDLTDEAQDNQCSNPAGTANSTNCDELQFSASSVEVDFEKKAGAVTVRLDLDFNGAANNAGGDDVEQMKFDWALPIASEFGLNLTGGIFNSPVGFESQDSPDKLQISNGQLFGLVPSNLVGLQLSGGADMVSGSVIFANDWQDSGGAGPNPGTLGEENTFGATFAINPMPEAGLSIGYLDSAAKSATQHEALVDVVVSGTVMPSMDLSLLYALEFVSNEKNDGVGLTLHAKHGKHGLTVRYDQVDCDNTSNQNNCLSTSNGQEPTTLTVAAMCSLEENLKLKLEWKDTDTDVAGTSSTDAITLQFVALF